MKPGCVAIVILLVQSALLAAEPVAPPPKVVDLGVAKVQFDEGYNRDQLKPGMFSVPARAASTLCYITASEGHLTGVGGLLGCLPTACPAGERIEAASFSRIGNEITLTLRRTKDKLKSVVPERYIVFAAQLPADLPVGNYHVQCNVVDEHAVSTTQPVTLECKFDLPDPSIAQGEDDVQQLATLSDGDLLKEYVKRGNALQGTNIGPMDDGIVFQASCAYEDDRNFSWQRAHFAIVERGKSIVPLLLEMLPREVPRNRGKDDHGNYGFGFARDLMEILGRIGDPRPVPLLLDILEGYHGNANPMLRGVAFDTLERLTYLSFLPFEDDQQNYCCAVPDASAKIPAGSDGIDRRFALAANYRAWLAGDGKDPSRWLPLARERARKILAGKNISDIYSAINFLQQTPYYLPIIPQPDRDDNPDATMARLAQIYTDAKFLRKDEYGLSAYSWGGLEIDLDLRVMGHYGPRARRYMPLLLRILHEQGETDDKIASLNAIGGELWMAELIRLMPKADADLSKYGFTLATTIEQAGAYTAVDPNRPKEDAVCLSQTIHWGIDRWSGRTFADAAEISAWWEKNKNRTQQQWLTDGLDLTATRADAGDLHNQVLLRCLLRDLPADSNEGNWCPPPGFISPATPSRPEKPFRVDWLKTHRDQLVYDDSTDSFRFKKMTAIHSN